MLSLTLFLLIVNASLLLGNALVYVVAKRKKNTFANEIEQIQAMNVKQSNYLQNYVKLQNLANRITRLETYIMSDTKTSNPAKFNAKLQKLVDFKNEAIIEIEALKDRIEEIEDMLGIKKKRRKTYSSEDIELQKKISELLYSAGKKR
ncbi:MAG: hypothetical protein J7L14_00250 [Candidatus Diapherotrites archaeon]|nr:hypothetical protein [Candidatus Diapherotrites archaeon]